MEKINRRITPSPCAICLDPLNSDQDIIFCPECGEPYHVSCWAKVGNKCKVRRCDGRSYVFWRLFEKSILGIFRINKSDLKSLCPNCSNSLSQLDRYCKECGYDVNSPEIQNKTKYLNFAKWVRHSHIYIFSIFIFTSIIFMLLVGQIFILRIYPIFNQFRHGSDKAPIVQVVYITVTPVIQSATPKITSTRLTPTRTPYPSPSRLIPRTRSPNATRTNQPTSCQGAPPIRIKINDLARVTYTNGEPLRLRSSHDLRSGNIVARLPEGTKMKIFAGPYCSDNFSWWFVKIRDLTLEGWVAEGDRNNYFIEMINRP